MCNVDTWHAHGPNGSVSTGTMTSCAADRDGDGLGDHWEFHYFGNLSQNGGGDYDGDGVNNGLESLMGRNPAVAGSSADINNTLRLRLFKPHAPGQ
jgi:hypothetical protein